MTVFAYRRERHGRVVNVSHSGLLIEMDEPPPVGTYLTLELSLADRSLTARAKVVRHSRPPQPKGMGVVLLHGLRMEDRIGLELLIERSRRPDREPQG